VSSEAKYDCDFPRLPRSAAVSSVGRPQQVHAAPSSGRSPGKTRCENLDEDGVLGLWTFCDKPVQARAPEPLSGVKRIPASCQSPADLLEMQGAINVIYEEVFDQAKGITTRLLALEKDVASLDSRPTGPDSNAAVQQFAESLK
jgi:hypothetical protein